MLDITANSSHFFSFPNELKTLILVPLETTRVVCLKVNSVRTVLDYFMALKLIFNHSLAIFLPYGAQGGI